MLVPLSLLFTCLLCFCDSHDIYGPSHLHRYNPTSSISASSNVESFSDSPSPPSSSLTGSNHLLTDTQINHYSRLNSLNLSPSCSQLKYLWKEAHQLAVNLYGPELAFNSPKLNANPFFLSNLLLRKHHHQVHPLNIGATKFRASGAVDLDGTPYLSRGNPETFPDRLNSILNPSSNPLDGGLWQSNNFNSKVNNGIYPEIGEFGSVSDQIGSFIPNNYDKQSPVQGQFSDDSIPTDNLGTIFGSIVNSPDQISTSSPLPNVHSPSSPLTNSLASLAVSSSRKENKHGSSPKLGFGKIISHSKETFDSGPEIENSHRASESSKKVDNFFTSGVWHDGPVDLSSYN